jgi:HD-GYP domain-containing protein (c-di-GMP phosphodiesterase class II)
MKSWQGRLGLGLIGLSAIVASFGLWLPEQMEVEMSIYFILAIAGLFIIASYFSFLVTIISYLISVLIFIFAFFSKASQLEPITGSVVIILILFLLVIVKMMFYKPDYPRKTKKTKTTYTDIKISLMPTVVPTERIKKTGREQVRAPVATVPKSVKASPPGQKEVARVKESLPDIQFKKPVASEAKSGLSVQISLIESIPPKIWSSGETRKITKEIVKYLNKQLDLADNSFILLRTNGHLEVLAAEGQLSEKIEGKTLRASSLIEALPVKGRPVNIPDLFSEPQISNSDSLLQQLILAQQHSLLLEAVEKDTFLACSSQKKAAFSNSDENKIEQVASQAKYILAGLEHQRQLETELKQAKQSLGLLKKLLPVRSIESVAQSTLKIALELVGGNSGSFMIADNQTKRLTVKAEVGSETQLGDSINFGEGIAGWVAKNRQPIVVNDLSAPLGTAKEKVGIASMSIPVTSENELIGVLNIKSSGNNFQPTKTQMKSLNQLLDQAASVIIMSRSTEQWQNLYFDTIKALTQIIETHDPYSKGHSKNVAKYVTAVAKEMHLPQKQLQSLQLAAIMHDIGYVGISKNIFQSSRPLTTVERVLIRTHPVVGSDALKEIPMLKEIIPTILYHHEHWDGSGYVSGLKGEEIPLGARILAVADAYDAMTSSRAYRSAYSVDKALDELKRNSGSQFDPKIVDIFVKLATSQPEKFAPKS